MPARIEGTAELQRRLKQMGDRVALVMNSAVEEASKPIMEDMVSRIHSVDGDLAASIQLAPRRGKAGGWSGVRIQATSPLGNHAHLVEFGHALVRDGAVVGSVPAHPFARPAMKAQKKLASSIMEDRLRKAVERD